MNHSNSAPTAILHLSKPYHFIFDYEKTINSDQIERQQIIELLKNGLTGKSDHQLVYWDESFISVKKDSSFELALQPGAVMLQRMIDKPSFKRILNQYEIHADSSFYVLSDGDIVASHHDREARITAAITHIPEFNDDLMTIAEIATAVGGVVFLNNLVSVTQWLTLHGYELHQGVKQTKNLIKHLEFNYSPPPPLGNYWGMIAAHDDHSVVLSPEERSKILALTAKYTGSTKKLLTDLCKSVFGQNLYAANHSTLLNCRELLHDFGTHPFFQSWSEGYIEALGWYGSNAGEEISDLYFEHILMTAIILDIHPAAGENEHRNHVADYNLYAPENTAKSVSEIIGELEWHLEQNHEVPVFASPLATYLLLAGRAPEFLVRELPDSLLLGTPEWITFCRGVALAEAIACGSALSMTYSQIMQLEAIEPVNKDLEILHGILAVDPIVDWALLNSIVTLAQVNSHYQDTVESAIAAYQKYSDVYTQTAATLATPLPTRKEISLEILRHIVPECNFLEEKILYEKQRAYHEFNNIEPLAMSMVELNMSNHLGTRHWDVKHGSSIYQAFPNLLPNLVSTEAVFKRRFDQVYAPLKQAMVTTIKLALSTLAPIDRTRLLCGVVTLFTLSPSVAFRQPPETFLQEKQKDKDAATGRYGVVMCSNYEGKLYCYELSTLQGKCWENPELARLIQSENLLQKPARVDFTNHINSLSKASQVFPLPTNIESYTYGVPRSNTRISLGVIDKLGTLPANGKTPRDCHRSYYMSFNNGEFDALADFVVKHRPVSTYDELLEAARDRTELELQLLKEEQHFETFTNIIVPFKSCIEDVTSDDPDRNADSILSCKIELAMTCLSVYGAAAKAAKIAGNTFSIASKSRALAKVGLGFINSVFNPLDGTPELLYGAGKHLKKGAQGISKVGLHSLKKATHHIRTLTGTADSYDLIKATQRTDVAQGTWRPLYSSVDSFAVAAINVNDNWYALNRIGKPWGKKLTNFEQGIKSRFLQTLMPDSFVLSYVKKSLPIAGTKIDTALHLLVTTTGDFEVNSLIKYIFGNNTAETVEHLAEALRAIKKDISHVTIKNVFLEKFPGESSLAAMYTDRFAQWKLSNYQPHDFHGKFLSVNPDEMTQYFRATKFDHGRVADGIVHEMSHGSQRTMDLMYADISPKNGRAGEIDVGPLMNLAKKPGGLNPATIGEGAKIGLAEFQNIKGSLPKLVANAPALLNADSYSLVVALLNQRSVNYPRFLENLAQMKNKYNAAKDGLISGTVIVNLSTFN